MENVKSTKKIKWYHYLLGFILLLIIVNTCSDKSKLKNDEKSNTENKEVVSGLDSVVSTKWLFYDDKDKMTSQTNYFASIDANNKLEFEFPYNGGSTASLIIRKKSGSTDIMLKVSKGQFITKYDGVGVKLRFDEKAAFTVLGQSSSDGSSDVLFLGSESKIIDNLKKSKKLIIQAEFYREGNQLIEFDIEGFEWKH